MCQITREYAYLVIRGGFCEEVKAKIRPSGGKSEDAFSHGVGSQKVSYSMTHSSLDTGETDLEDQAIAVIREPM
jgi:hypothetical protein